MKQGTNFLRFLRSRFPL